MDELDKQSVRTYIHAMGYYSALRKEGRKEIQTYTTAQMNPEDILLTEISQWQKDKYFMIPFIWDIYRSQNQRDRK